VDELQEALEQAINGIVGLTAGPWSGWDTQLDAATPEPSTKGAGTKTSASTGATRTQGAGRGKTGRWGGSRCHTPCMDLCRICKQLGHWAKECDQRKNPATENADIKGVSCPLVSPLRYTW